MNQEAAWEFAKQLNIDVYNVVREEWELKLLKTIFELSIGNKIYFKGGTALRLAYGSPRFSEDLAFSVLNSITNKELSGLVNSIKKFPEVEISDFASKHHTFLIEGKIKESFLPRRFTVKTEISKRKTSFKHSLILLTSPISNLQVLARVEKISDIYEEKIAAYKDRRKPRDLFDLWFIASRLKKPLPSDLPRIQKRHLKQELSRFLPRGFAKVIEELVDSYGE